MNDSEIIKALECCLVLHKCEECPCDFDANGKTLCNDLGLKILDLINRQQAMIEELLEENRIYKAANMLISRQRDERDKEIECLESELQTVRFEAVREFAESLKRKSELVAPSIWAIPYRAVAVADIDKLLEERGCNDEL